MFELLRRIVVMVVVGAAAVTYLFVPAAVVRLRPEDPFDWYEQAYAPQSALGATGYAESLLRQDRALLPPAAFIEHHLQGRVKDVAGVEWQELRTRLSATDGVFLATDAAPVAAVLTWLRAARDVHDPAATNTSGGNFVYLRFVDDAGPRFAGLTVISPGDLDWSSVPIALRNPLRHYAFYLLPAAAIVYLTPPRPRKLAHDALTYPRLSIVLTDVISLALTAFFFIMPWFIVIGQGKPSALLGFGIDGFGPITLVFWFLATSSAALLVVAGMQTVRQVVLLPDGLRDRTWRHDVTVRFDEIASVRPIVVELPRGLRRLIWVIGLFARSPLLISQVLLFGSARHPGLVLQLYDGSQLRILALPGLERVIGSCRRAGVPFVENTTPEGATIGSP